jgi:hypothetical protein
MNESIKIVVRNELKQLSENGLTTVHRRSSRGRIPVLPAATPIYFKSFETVFVRYSLAILDFLRVLNSSTGHFWVCPHILQSILISAPLAKTLPENPDSISAERNERSLPFQRK